MRMCERFRITLNGVVCPRAESESTDTVSRSRPAKAAQIRGYAADLVIAGDLYVDALAASEASDHWIGHIIYLHFR